MGKVSAFSNPLGDRTNQDCIGFRQEAGLTLLVVADGMGGEKGGDIASNVAVDTLIESFDSKGALAFENVFDLIKQRMGVVAERDPALRKMGTTLTACLISDGHCEFVHVGDSRIYQLRGNGLISQTKDQTEVQHLLDEKIITKAQAKRYPRKNILLSVVSLRNDFEVQRGSFPISTGDRLLLVSDGLYKILSKRELVQFSSDSDSVRSLIQKVEGETQKRGLVDDCSVVGYEHF